MKELLRSLIRGILRIIYICPVDTSSVYLISFNGTSYGFDAKAVAEYISENYPDEYKLYWEVKNKKLFNCPNQKVCLINKKSFRSIYHVMTAGLIICNFVPRSYIPFRKEQVIINTWHGNPLKKVGKYAIRYNHNAYSLATCFVSHSAQYTDLVIRDSFEYKGNVLNCGVPRNDIFFMSSRNEKAYIIKKELDLLNKNILLYAPTFRGDYEQESSILDEISIRNALTLKFGGEWVILYRLHPMAAAQRMFDKKEATIDVSSYPDMQDLLLIADILITDYSSSMWDFSLQRKPVFLYVNDLDEYMNNRGLYFPITDLPYYICATNEEIVSAINTYNASEYQNKLNNYFKKTGCYENGKSIETILEYVKQYGQ